jgi:hypothetical protein
MKKHRYNNYRIFLFILLPLVLATTMALAQNSSWLFYGTVTWNGSTAAASVKMRLLKGRDEKKIVYTNAQGRYGFFDIPGQPADYSLEVWFDKKKYKTLSPTELQQVQRGKKLDIRLER